MYKQNSRLKLFTRVLGLSMILAVFVWSDSNAQLLEEGEGRLKTIKGQSRGFIFFRRKIKSEDPSDARKGKAEKVNVKYSSPVTYGKKEKATNVRYSQPPFSSRDKRADVRYSKKRKETFFDIYITQQLKSKRRLGPPPDTEGMFGKTKFSFIAIFDRPGIGPLPSAARLYGKSRLSLQKPWVYRNTLSVTEGMTFDIDRRLAEQFRPLNEFTLRYQGDHKRKNPFLENIYRRIGQWQISSYKGHHTNWSKFGRKNYMKGTSSLVGNYQGHIKTLIPILDNISDRIRNFEQTHYQGHTTGWSKLGYTAYVKGLSSLSSNYQGDIKVKRRKGGDMHPSISYISGKRFANNAWKERWRKLNVLWVRMNPGKEVPDGAKEKIKVKYDKEERDLWTY